MYPVRDETRSMRTLVELFLVLDTVPVFPSESRYLVVVFLQLIVHPEYVAKATRATYHSHVQAG